MKQVSSPTSDQRGVSESIQWAILGAAFLVSLLAMVEVGLVWHGRSLSTEAALAGANAQSVLRAPAGSGLEAATAVAVAGGLKNVQVQVNLTGTVVTVIVTGSVSTGLGLVTVRAETRRPLEGS